MNGMCFFLAVLLLILTGAICVYRIKRKIREVSNSIFGMDSLKEGFRNQELEFEETPKSVSGMTSLYGPRIEADFPELSVTELMRRSENQLKEMLEALEYQDVTLMRGASSELKRSVQLKIADLVEREVHLKFEDVKIHRTAIAKYTKSSGFCSIVVQSAVEYRYLCRDRMESGEVQGKKKQTRYDMEWIYVQDPEKIPEYAGARTLNCPNCGAVVSAIGNKTCEYCGSSIEAINIRTWSLDQIKEC